jgi:hypothetical protein
MKDDYAILNKVKKAINNLYFNMSNNTNDILNNNLIKAINYINNKIQTDKDKIEIISDYLQLFLKLNRLKNHLQKKIKNKKYQAKNKKNQEKTEGKF